MYLLVVFLFGLEMNTLKNLIIRVLTKKDLMGGKGQSRGNGNNKGKELT